MCVLQQLIQRLTLYSPLCVCVCARMCVCVCVWAEPVAAEGSLSEEAEEERGRREG